MQDYAVRLYERIREYIEKVALSQGDVARLVGLPVRKFNYYLTEKSQVNLWPLLPLLLQNDKKLSRDWLYFGEGPMFMEATEACDAGQSPQFLTLGELLPATVASPIRLTGLTECELHGWFSRAYRSVNVSPPRCGEQWVVVQAMGDSMVPHGIMEGYTLFCDPSQPPATGEAVYALRRDGYATVKVFQGRDAQGRLVLQGWQAAALCAGNIHTNGEEGRENTAETDHRGGVLGGQPTRMAAGTATRKGYGMHEPYYLYCSPADIALLAPVIYIKCRL